MFKPDDATAVAGQYTEGTPGVVAPTRVRADHLNAITNEIVNVVLSQNALVKTDSTQLLAAVSRLRAKGAVMSLTLAKSTGATDTLRAATTGPLRVFAVGENGKIARAELETSHNFVIDSPAGAFAGDFNDIVYDAVNAVYVAVGTLSAIQTSDGNGTWTAQISPGGVGFRAVATGGGISVAVGTTENIWRGVTPSSWASKTSPFSGTPDITDIAYGAGNFVCITEDGRCAYSPDGNTPWVVCTGMSSVLATNDPAHIDYHESIGFIAHHDTDVFHSTDGITFTKIHDDVSWGSSTHAPGLLVLPYAWAIGYGVDGCSAEIRYSVSDVDADVDAYAYSVNPNEISWWKVVDGQLLALRSGTDDLWVGQLV